MWNEEYLDGLLSRPSPALIEDIARIDGDIMLLGAGGKIGPNLALMAKRAVMEAGINKRVIAVSRFADPIAAELLHQNEIETISADLLEDGAVDRLPDVENIIFLAGRKFGTVGGEHLTWASNASLPTLVARRFKGSSIVAFSTGNIYSPVTASSGGADDETDPAPIGEYAMSSLARERIFEHAAAEYGSKVLLLRLNYAVDLRYGVLYDLAEKLLAGETVSLEPGCFNCVWQGYVNEVTIRSLLYVTAPATHLNVTGPETISIRYAAEQLARELEVEPTFSGTEGDRSFLNNAARCFQLFGYPQVTLRQMIQWQAEWLKVGGRVLNKPTHFEEQGGNF